MSEELSYLNARIARLEQEPGAAPELETLKRDRCRLIDTLAERKDSVAQTRETYLTTALASISGGGFLLYANAVAQSHDAERRFMALAALRPMQLLATGFCLTSLLLTYLWARMMLGRRPSASRRPYDFAFDTAAIAMALVAALAVMFAMRLTLNAVHLTAYPAAAR